MSHIANWIAHEIFLSISYHIRANTINMRRSNCIIIRSEDELTTLDTYSREKDKFQSIDFLTSKQIVRLARMKKEYAVPNEI